MPNLDSEETRRQFKTKLQAEEDASSRDHYFYFFRLGDRVVARTKVSRGPRHTIDNGLIARMARQLGVSTGALTGAVRCSLDAAGFYRLLAMGVSWRTQYRVGRGLPSPKRPHRSNP